MQYEHGRGQRRRTVKLNVEVPKKLLEELDEPMTVDELAANLELDIGEIHNRIASLSRFDRSSETATQSAPWSR